jgi:hypothetical protein
VIAARAFAFSSGRNPIEMRTQFSSDGNARPIAVPFSARAVATLALRASGFEEDEVCPGVGVPKLQGTE